VGVKLAFKNGRQIGLQKWPTNWPTKLDPNNFSLFQHFGKKREKQQFFKVFLKIFVKNFL
jgi:hypothetical protein